MDGTTRREPLVDERLSEELRRFTGRLDPKYEYLHDLLARCITGIDTLESREPIAANGLRRSLARDLGIDLPTRGD